MRAVLSYWTAIVMMAMLVPAGGSYAQDNKLSVPNLRNPYFGRYRVEEDKFAEVPCSATRIAFGPNGKCLQGYRLGLPGMTTNTGANPCDMALDVVIDTAGKIGSRSGYPVV